MTGPVLAQYLRKLLTAVFFGSGSTYGAQKTCFQFTKMALIFPEYTNDIIETLPETHTFMNGKTSECHKRHFEGL